MEDDQQGWRKMKQMRLDRKNISRRVKKAEGATQRHAHRFIIRRIDNFRLVVRHITLWLLLIGIMIAALGVQLLWGQTHYMDKGRVAGGTYVEGVVGSVGSLNPLFATTASEASTARLMFSSLYNYDDTGTLHQDLATSMKIGEDDTVYTVRIRDDVSWHDKRPLNADDIIFTLNLIKNPLTHSPLMVNWTYVKVKKVDSLTVQFTLPAPYAAFPQALTFPILPEHLLKDVQPGALRESVYSQAPVGSGPFAFRRYQVVDVATNRTVVHLTSNKDYYNGAPHIARFELHTFATSDDMVKALNSGQLNGASDVPLTRLNDIDTSRYTINSLPLDSGVYLLFNLQNADLKDKNVRKALQLATDTAAIRDEFNNKVKPLSGPITHNLLSGGDSLPSLSYNPKTAASLMKKAGWKLVDGVWTKKKKQLSITITSTKDSEYEKVVSLVEAQWKQFGVNVDREIIDTSGAASTFVQDVLQGRNFDVLLRKLSIGADPDVYAYWHSSQISTSGFNFSSYENETSDAILSSARSRLEIELRTAKYKQFIKQWQADAPAVPLYQSSLEYVVNNNSQSVEPTMQLVEAADRYADVQHWTVTGQQVYKTP